MARSRSDDPDHGALQVRRRGRPGVRDVQRVRAEHPRARDQANERVDHRPAQRHALVFAETRVEPAPRASAYRRADEGRVDEQIRVDERHVTPRCARRSSSSVASSTDTSETSRTGPPSSRGSGGGSAGRRVRCAGSGGSPRRGTTRPRPSPLALDQSGDVVVERDRGAHDACTIVVVFPTAEQRRDFGTLDR